MRNKWLHAVVSLGLGVALLAGCEQKGAAEKAGEKVGEKLEEAGKKVKEATK